MSCRPVIESLVQKYLAREHVESAVQIAEGPLSAEFAEELASLLSRHTQKPARVIGSWNLNNIVVDDPDWSEIDWNKAGKEYPGSGRPQGLADMGENDVIDRITDGEPFAIVEVENRYYDAESPDGVDNIFDLPVFRRCLKASRQVNLPR